MGTYSLELDFIKPSEGDLPGPPVAQIHIKTFTTDQNGKHFITPQCVSLSEVEYEIDRLEKELKELRAKAKRKFKP